MNYKKLLIIAVVILAVIFAGSKILFDSGYSQNEHDHLDEGKSSQVTVWGDRFEIFLEHPFVLVNTPTGFVTHVTDRVTL